MNDGTTGDGSPEGEGQGESEGRRRGGGGADASDAEAGGAGYRRSAGSPRGEARKKDLLERVTDDLAANGLVDFSLRRAARAAGTTHKVLLYHFDGVEDLLRQAVGGLRDRRIANALAAVAGPPERSLGDRVREVWRVLVEEEPGLSLVLDQAMGLAMYDRARYGDLSRHASGQYLPFLMSVCPQRWTGQRRVEVAEMILATLRGFLLERSASGDDAGVAAGLEALVRALDREEAADGAQGGA
ncbi:TetR/AcrR family transcriptional regulator [Actinacidiphila rubida]|uniref:TetR/AcrR family transcriptional regulator n=1 Tax=Actinacidiphila rubida TaxID=310780 RepID=UPI001C42F49F|nr:TetR/AcrR family transcriptional regulator [Actinacidiphila rubida]